MAARKRPDQRRDTRLRFEQWAKNPVCQANTMSAVHNIKMHKVAEQAVERADVAGLGHHRHTRFWQQLTERDCVVAL